MCGVDEGRGTAEQYEYVALCPAGFEEPLAGELRAIGCRGVRPLHGSVTFEGDLRQGYRACLWSRLASRIVAIIARVGCSDPEELYAAAREVAWEDHVGSHATIAVEARGGNDGIRDLRFATLRVKDAVCDHLRDLWGARPYVDTERPDVRIVCTIRAKRATLGIDLGGSSLIDHDYRVLARGRATAGTTGFVREDMAALMLEMGGWAKTCRRAEGAHLVDPLGSSPVLALEAACVAADRAPRLRRRHWGFTGWKGHDEQVWAEELASAERRFEEGLKGGHRVIVACPDPGVRAEIGDMARRAEVAGLLDVRPCGVAELDLGQEWLRGGLVAAVVPDGGTVGLAGNLAAAMASLATLVRGPALAEAPVVALCSGDLMRNALGYGPEVTCDVINGKDDARVLLFASPAQEARRAEGEGRPVPSSLITRISLPGDRGPMDVLVPSTEQFAARLHKVAKSAGKWARRNDITCYRVYDADMPDYAVSIDIYEGSAVTPGRWLVVSEYAAPREIDPAVAARRLSDALAVSGRILDVDPQDVFLKVRRHEKGGSQYADRAALGRTALVEEGGLIFEVNFTDYLDTGLFLDHRPVRAMLRDMAPRTRFLNLFAYTGSASCYAADGDAYQTTTVDLSNTYLAWARRNMEQNGFVGPHHEFVQADVTRWIDEQRHTANRWDLIFIDPPTFSNSARMRRRGFEVQQDHSELIIGASRLLTRNGSIVFSCNLRGFEPDEAALERAGVIIEDISGQTIPTDFARNAKIHHCYIARRA